MQTILCLEKVVCDYIVNHFIRKLRDISLYLPDIQLHSASSELWNEQHPVLEFDYRGYRGRRTKDIWEDQQAGGPKILIA